MRTRNTLGQIMVAIIGISSFSACALEDRGFTADAGSHQDKTMPADCEFNAASLCWKYSVASGDARIGGYAVGCLSAGDCLLFCDVVPPGYTQCFWVGTESEPLCRDWTPPEPKLSDCSTSTDSHYGTVYTCPGCPFKEWTYTPARNAAGQCVTFSDNCLPEGFAASKDCP